MNFRVSMKDQWQLLISTLIDLEHTQR